MKHNKLIQQKLNSTTLQKIGLMLPGFGIYVFLIIFSIFLCFYYSFFDWDGISKSMDFVGFTNYIRTLKNSAFRLSLQNTFFYAILGTVLVNIIALVLSSALNRKNRFTNFLRSAFFFPQLISLVAIGFIFKGLLSYVGIFNSLLENIGLAKIDFLGNPAIARWTILFTSIWQSTGFATVLYLAGLQAIPEHLYDAAKIDGATPWMNFRYITFPWLAPSFTSVTIFLFTGYMKIFDVIYVLTMGGPAGSTAAIANHIMMIGFNQFRISYASAIAIYLMTLVAVISMILTNVLRKREENIIG